MTAGHAIAPRPAIRGLALVYLLCVFLASTAAFAQGAEQFANWHERWLTDTQRSDGEAALAAVRQEGLATYYDKTRVDVEALGSAPDAAAQDKAWVANFLRVMDEFRKPLDESIKKADAALAAAPVSATPGEVSSSMTSELRKVLKGDPFNVSLQNQRDFKIFAGATSEISIPPDSTSRIARELFRKSAALSVVIVQQNLPAMAFVSESIGQAKDRWDKFMANAISDQFMWETWVNAGLAGSRFETFSGSLAYPPRTQLRFLHPAAAEVVALQGESTFRTRIAIEVIGLRRFAAETYEPSLGFAIAAIPKASPQESWGYGLTYSRKTFSIGVVVQDLEQGHNVVQLVVGMKLAQFIKDKGSTLQKRVDDVKLRLDGIKRCVADAQACAGASP